MLMDSQIGTIQHTNKCIRLLDNKKVILLQSNQASPPNRPYFNPTICKGN